MVVMSDAAPTAEVPAAAPEQPKRVTRPKLTKGRQKPAQYYEARKHYVEGEGIEEKNDGSFYRRYLSLRQLAKLVGVSVTTVHEWSRNDNWTLARQEFEEAARQHAEVLERQKAAEARALESADSMALADTFINRFKANLINGKVRTDSVADFERMARLKAFLVREKDPAANKGAVVSIEELQGRHTRTRTRVHEIPAEATGVQPKGGAGHEQDEDGTQGAALDKLSGLG